MYWTLLIILPYLSALAAGGIPTYSSQPNSGNIALPPSNIDPKAETSNLHYHCGGFIFLHPPDYQPHLLYPDPQTNLQPSSPQRNRPVSPGPGRPISRAAAPPPVYIAAKCKKPNGRESLAGINLNKCLGWDDHRKAFTAEYEYVSPIAAIAATAIASSWNCWDCGYKKYRKPAWKFILGCKCSTNAQDRTQWEVKEFTQPGVLVYNEKTGQMGCHGYFADLNVPDIR
ncbi:hypothetical protein ANOM_000397, partial [Aspergillus nomiae NRRL 13137]